MSRRDRLAAVVRLSSARERQAQRQAAEARARAEQARVDRDELHRALRAEVDALRAPMSGTAASAEHERLGRRAAVAGEADEHLTELLDRELVAQTELLAAVRRRRQTEELQGRRVATHAALVARVAQKSLDEIATLRHRRAR